MSAAIIPPQPSVLLVRDSTLGSRPLPVVSVLGLVVALVKNDERQNKSLDNKTLAAIPLYEADIADSRHFIVGTLPTNRRHFLLPAAALSRTPKLSTPKREFE